MNDKELCAASGRGQSDAFVELVRRYEGAVCAVAYAVTQRRDLSEDIAQETFIVAWTKLPGIQAPERVGGWLTGIARNIARRTRPSDRVETSSDVDRHVATDPGVEQRMLEDEGREELHRVLGGLPLRYREALVLYYRDEQSAARVAALLGISTSAAEQRISRGRKMLRAKLERAVERELVRTRPGAAFRRRVAAALPPLTPLAGATTTASAATTLGSILAMKKLLVVIAAVLALAAVYALRSRAEVVRDAPQAAAATGGEQARRRPMPSAALPSPSLLTGAVSSVDGPLAGAVVTIVDSAGNPAVVAQGDSIKPATVRVAADGRWRLEGLSPGTYTVAATARGFLPALSDPVELVAEQPAESVDLQLTRGGHSVTGSVQDAGGGPVAGAVVRAVRAGLPPYSTTSDEDGSYALTLPGGPYTLDASDPDYQSQTRRITLQGSDRALDFELIPGAAIFGTVVDRATGAPVPNAVVSFHRKFRSGRGFASNRSADHERVVTDAQGRFALRQLRAAEYRLDATADHAASRASTTVAVGVADQESDVLLLVDPAVNLSGRVVDRNDATVGIADVDIEAFGVGTQVSVETTTDADGAFVLHGLRPGSYPLTVRGRDVIVSSTTAEVGDADIAGLTVSVERGTTLRGRIVPPAAGSIALDVPEDALGRERFELARKVSRAQTHASADGTFELSVPEGEWTLVATTEDGSRGTTPVSIPDGGLREEVRVATTPRPFIAGHLVDANGDPVVGATLTVVPYVEGASPADLFFMSRSPVKATSDVDGAFALLGLKAASYRLTLEDRSGGAMQPSQGPAFELIEVNDAPVEGLNLVVAPSTGTLRGVVRDPNGDPFGEAWVEVIARDETTPNELRTPSLTDRSGSFSFTQLRPGLYDVFAASTQGDATASIEGVELGTHDLTLEPLGVVRGTVTVDGAAVELFSVRAEDQETRAFYNRDGRFEVERLPLGPQRILVTADAGAGWVSVDVQKEQDVELELSPWGQLKGRLVDGDAAALVGVQLSIHADGGRRPGAEDVVRTDREGRFTIEGVGAGLVRLHAIVRAGQDDPRSGVVRGTAISDEVVDLGDVSLDASGDPQ